MNSRFSRWSLSISIGLGCLFAGYLVVFRASNLTSADDLGMLIFLQVLLAVLWKFQQRFFPFLIAIFLGAATVVPFQSAWISGRWFILGVGAVVGCVVCLKDRLYSLGAFHFVALFCVLAALLSATAPEYPSQAILKALSLLLLFLYGSFGARVAVFERERRFTSGLLWGCEALVYLLAVTYFIFHIEFLGNPNSLGLVTGVVALPLMLWGILVSDRMLVRRRRGFAFWLALLLLLSSYSRASIAAAAFSCVLLCLVMRRYKLLMKGCVFTLLAAVLVVTIAPPKSETSGPETSGSITSAFLYKGHQGTGLLDSRKSVWQETISTIQEHPWLGTGFGTIGTSFDTGEISDKFASSSTVTREHGNSYLAIVEGVGLLGVVPFLTLVLLVAINATRVLVWTRNTRDPRSLAFPIAIFLVAGLVHAGFEDWLFAVGNYLCVFFWSLAFILGDLLPAKESRRASLIAFPDSPLRMDSLGVVPSAR
ncbi:MAG: O-antigen ligase family protein [Terriglobales bacterium]